MAENIAGASGIIFNIQRFSLHDGAGIRTLVFFKGCPLRCRWCSNPEGLEFPIQVMEHPEKCIGCGVCAKVCKQGAIKIKENFCIDRETCIKCGTCAKYCPSNAKLLSGEQKTADEIVEAVKRDAPFYGNYGGGVTIGGGEMLSQPAFAWEILRRCREEGISTAVETCGHGQWKWLARIADICDIIYFDVKEIDPVRHKRFTGVDNTLILENLKNLDAHLSANRPSPKLTLRLPLIEGYNLTESYIEEISDYIKANLSSYHVIELLPFHNFGEQKYKKLGMAYELEGRPNSSPGDMKPYLEILAEKGLPAYVAKW